MNEGKPLEGGVASDIRLIDGSNGKVVVKRALAKLRVKADWFSDPLRSGTEVAAIEAFTEILGGDSVPEILWVRPEENTFAMKFIDTRFRNWKQDLLSGRVDFATALRAGSLLGQVHTGSTADGKFRERFSDRTYFNELRVDPFFIRVANKMPECRDDILSVVDEMNRCQSVLVHGDFSPKNILADGGNIVVLDFEVAHWGDPMFDVGFCISHLILKGMRRQSTPATFQNLITKFISGYRRYGQSINESHLNRLIGCLLLSRVEGSSPVDYLSDLDSNRVRAVGVAAVTQPEKTFTSFINSALEFA